MGYHMGLHSFRWIKRLTLHNAWINFFIATFILFLIFFDVWIWLNILRLSLSHVAPILAEIHLLVFFSQLPQPLLLTLKVINVLKRNCHAHHIFPSLIPRIDIWFYRWFFKCIKLNGIFRFLHRTVIVCLKNWFLLVLNLSVYHIMVFDGKGLYAL